MRTFIAFEFDNPLKRRISLIQSKLKELSLKGRWTPDDNFHITLKFLGDITIEESKKIENQLFNLLPSFSPVSLSLDDIGFFPGDKDIRVLYLGLKDKMKALGKINSEIENSMEKLGYSREKRTFRPHITLGRNIVLKDDFNKIKEMLKEDCNYTFILNRVSFMESQLVNGKRIYTPLRTYILNK
mgnify:CR=1 FL=1